MLQDNIDVRAFEENAEASKLKIICSEKDFRLYDVQKVRNQKSGCNLKLKSFKFEVESFEMSFELRDERMRMTS
jgi:hypothetical protein